MAFRSLKKHYYHGLSSMKKMVSITLLIVVEKYLTKNNKKDLTN